MMTNNRKYCFFYSLIIYMLFIYKLKSMGEQKRNIGCKQTGEAK